ncbi:MAG: FkbM family methyltransferase [Thermoleophilaceae bacterium]
MALTSARALAERLLARRGLEIRRAGKGPRRTLGEVLAHVTGLGLRPGAVIDVGVGYGTPELYAPFPTARHLLVEPLREYEPQLRPVAERIGAAVVYAAAGAEPGETTIHVHRAPTLSSIHDAGRGDAAATVARTVSVVRVDELVRERGLPGPYVLKVDVEGAELEVVAGAEGLLGQTELVLLETSLFRHLGENPELADVVAAMGERGFAPYDIYGGHLRPSDGALAQVDVAFVREDGRFRRDHAYATPEQAERLYASWGF